MRARTHTHMHHIAPLSMNHKYLGSFLPQQYTWSAQAIPGLNMLLGASGRLKTSRRHRVHSGVRANTVISGSRCLLK